MMSQKNKSTMMTLSHDVSTHLKQTHTEAQSARRRKRQVSDTFFSVSYHDFLRDLRVSVVK